MEIKGVLIPIGGNEDKGHAPVDEGYSLDFVEEGILARVVMESGGPSSKIVFIPTASRIPDEVSENYRKAFGKLGCSDLTILDIRDRADAEEEINLEHIRTARCVMFSGGDQSRIVDIIGGSTMHQILVHRYKNERIVIAGTSAGAMCMSTEMIAGGSSTEALQKGSVIMRDGMNFIPGLIIDSHFIQRGRFGRVSEAVARFPDLLGVGLSEDTGMIIENGNKLKVIGSGMVIIFDPKELTHNFFDLLPEGTPMTMTNLKVHVLSNGDTFYINERVIHALPIEADFE